MKVVYANEEAPDRFASSIFLAGPTPRDAETPSWRPAALAELERRCYMGVVFVPECRDKWSHDYDTQVEWEKKYLTMADVNLFWVPREIQKMPAFTTNVEFGTWIDSGKLVYGRPDGSAKNRYLDWLYQDRGLGQPHKTLEGLIGAVVKRLNFGSLRFDGERNIPLHIWDTKMFQLWYARHQFVDNWIHDAKVLWQYNVKGNVFASAIWVKMWIEAEQRYKENEFVLSRPDIATIFGYRLDEKDFLDSKVVIVKEFRSAVRNRSCLVHELPGGSSFVDHGDWQRVAHEEFHEETGLDIDDPERFVALTRRQLMGTFSTHAADLYAIELTESEIEWLEKREEYNETFGIAEDSEKTYVEVTTLRKALQHAEVDWSMMGMFFQGISHAMRWDNSKE